MEFLGAIAAFFFICYLGLRGLLALLRSNPLRGLRIGIFERMGPFYVHMPLFKKK